MNLNPIAILAVVVISALVFGGIILFGPGGGTTTTAPSPSTSGAISHIPDILNLPGFGNRQNQPSGGQNVGGGSTPAGFSGRRGADIVVEKSELPSPSLPSVLLPAKPANPLIPIPSQSYSGQLPTTRTPMVPSQRAAGTPPPSNVARPPSSARPLGSPQLPQATTSITLPSVFQKPTPAQAAAIASFSVFDASPELRDFRAQMVKEGVIKDTEFVKINNNNDMEQFLLQLVEWKGKQASSTPAQMQDSRNRIIKAYDRIQASRTGR